jgi:hypothetical protein
MGEFKKWIGDTPKTPAGDFPCTSFLKVRLNKTKNLRRRDEGF